MIAEAIDVLGEDIAMAHIKDFKVENNSLVSVAAGTGEMNYDRIIRFMKELQAVYPCNLREHRAGKCRGIARIHSEIVGGVPCGVVDFLILDNAVWRTIDKIGKIFLLNLLWLICSLPVFTIGASTTALIYTSMKLSDNEGDWHQNFFSSFKENFRTGRRRCFLLDLAAGAFLAGDFLFGGRAGQFLRAADAGRWRQFCLYRIFFRSSMCSACRQSL